MGIDSANNIITNSNITLYYLLAILVCLVIGLLINALLSFYFYEVAKEKGFYRKCYFWIPFFFGFIGYILVAALPDRGRATEVLR